MNKFEVGMVYEGWYNRGDGFPALVVAIAPDRSYVMMTCPQGRNPLAARRHKIINDPRFGEKAFENYGIDKYVWRADKAWKQMDVPAGWFDADAKERKEAATEAAKTRKGNKAVKELAAKITPRIMARVEAMRARALGAGEEWNEERFLARFGNAPEVEVNKPQKDRKGLINARVHVRSTDNDNRHGAFLYVYEDKLVMDCFALTGDDFTNLFKAA